jgi:mevalonate kinase
MRKIIVSAPAKVHLSGEHSVVYGQPALLAAINKRLFVTLEPERDGLVKVKSEVPLGAGLGSSAAWAVALTGAVLLSETKRFDLEEINQIAYEMEREQHGNPSGGDNTICCFGGFLKFQKLNGQFKFEKIKVGRRLPQFLLIDSGKPKETTKDMVELVSEKFKVKSLKLQLKVKNLIKDLGRVTRQIIACFTTDQFNNSKNLIRENERLLEELGVVGEKAKKIIRLIERNEGVGKICGAGGIKKGSGMILAYHPNLKKLELFLKANKLSFMDIKLACEGVRIEEN